MNKIDRKKYLDHEVSYVEWYSQFLPYVELIVETRLRQYLEADSNRNEMERKYAIPARLGWKERLQEIYNQDRGMNIIPLKWWDGFLPLFLANVFLQGHFAEVSNGFAIAPADATCMAKIAARKLIGKGE